MVRRCRVTVADVEGVEHSITVEAASLFEAIARGIAAIRGAEWSNPLIEGLSKVRVTVQNPAVDHAVTMQRFQEWLARDTGPPAERTRRARVRDILEGRTPNPDPKARR